MKPNKKDAPHGSRQEPAGADEAQRERLEKERGIFSPESGNDVDADVGEEGDTDKKGPGYGSDERS